MKLLVTETRHTSLEKPHLLLQQWLQMAQWLSLDVALGAMCSAAMVCRLLNVWPLPWLSIGVLGGIVLLIYTVDHLYDAHRMPVRPVTGRHLFHWRYKLELQIFAGLLIISVGLISFLLLPTSIIIFGTVLGSLVLIYLFLVNRIQSGQADRWFHKELCVAFVYTAGVWGVGWVQATHISIIHLLLALAFGLIVLQNLLLFSWYEQEEDIRQQQRSVVQTWGMSNTRKVICALFILSAANAWVVFNFSGDYFVQQVLFVFIMMSGMLALLFYFPHLFRKDYRYRLIGDGVFFIPGFLLLNQLLFT